MIRDFVIGDSTFVFVELIVLLPQPVDRSVLDHVLQRFSTHRREDIAGGVAIVGRAEPARRTELSFGTTSIYDDPEWETSVAATDPGAWQRIQPVVHQVDLNGRSLERGDLDVAYASAMEIAACGNGMVWDAIVEEPIGSDPRAAAERCAAVLDQAEADYAARRTQRGFLARLFGR